MKEKTTACTNTNREKIIKAKAMISITTLKIVGAVKGTVNDQPDFAKYHAVKAKEMTLKHDTNCIIKTCVEKQWQALRKFHVLKVNNNEPS